MRKTEDITNLHYTHNNEIQFEYGGQTHHYNMDNLKKLFINYWNLLDVLEEIREYIKEHKDYLEKAKEMYIDCENELLKTSCIQLINNELLRSDDLLQIIDKGVNNE